MGEFAKPSHQAAYDSLTGIGIKIPTNFRDLSFLVTHIHNSDEVFDRMSLEERVHFLGRYYEIIASEVDRYGRIDRFHPEDGSMLAVFGDTPSYHPENAYWAVTAAIRLRYSLAMFALKVGIGINTGRAFTGDIVTAKTRQFTTYGESVDNTWKIAQLTQTMSQSILVGEQTYSQIRDTVEVGEVIFPSVNLTQGQNPLTGRNRPLAIFPLRGFKIN